MALMDRVRNMLVTPKTEWPIVAVEPATVGSIYSGYVIPLAGAASVAALIGRMLFAHNLISSLVLAILTFVLSLIGVYVVGIIAATLAPSFGGVNDPIQGLKWAAYSQTGAWVGGLANIIPFAGALIALVGALYSLYLFFLGTAPVMRVPQDKVLGFAVVVILVEIVVSVIIGLIVGAIAVAAAFGGAAVGAAR